MRGNGQYQELTEEDFKRPTGQLWVTTVDGVQIIYHESSIYDKDHKKTLSTKLWIGDESFEIKGRFKGALKEVNNYLKSKERS